MLRYASRFYGGRIVNTIIHWSAKVLWSVWSLFAPIRFTEREELLWDRIAENIYLRGTKHLVEAKVPHRHWAEKVGPELDEKQSNSDWIELTMPFWWEVSALITAPSGLFPLIISHNPWLVLLSVHITDRVGRERRFSSLNKERLVA